MLVDMVVEAVQTTLVVVEVVLVQQELHGKLQEHLVVDLVEMVFQFQLIALLHISMLVVVVEWLPQKDQRQQVMVDRVVLEEVVVDPVEGVLPVQMEEMLVKQAHDRLHLLEDQQDIVLVQVVVVEHTLEELVVMVVPES
jgi:hypothetical protein